MNPNVHQPFSSSRIQSTKKVTCVTKGNRMKKTVFLLYLHKAVERLRPRIEEGGYRHITEEHVELQTEINIMNFEKVAFITGYSPFSVGRPDQKADAK